MAIIKTPFNKQLVHRVFHHSSRATFKIFWDLGRPSLQILVIRRLDLMFTVVSQTPIHFSALTQIVTRSSSPPTCVTAVACKGYGGGAPRHASHSCSCCEHVGRPHPAYLRSTPGNQVRRGGGKKSTCVIPRCAPGGPGRGLSGDSFGWLHDFSYASKS